MTIHYNQYFHGDISAQGAHFGVGAGERMPSGPGARPRTGPLDAGDVSAAISRYVPPLGYARAADTLAIDRVVVLAGRRGIGKRTGAIVLLREVTDQALSVLSPTTALAELSRYEFRCGQGYLIADYTEVADARDIEFDWRTVRARVRECGAWLIVTTVTGTRHGEAVTCIEWARPAAVELVAAWLADSATGPGTATADTEAVVAALPPESAMADMVAVLERVCAGATVADAARALNDSGRAEVRRWFDENGPRTRTQVLEVAALAFLGPSSRRYFESRLAELAAAIDTALPIPERAPAPTEQSDDFLPEQRSATVGHDSLITISRSTTGRIPGQVLTFRVPSYRRNVVDELWARMGIAFWDGLTTWLRQVAATTGTEDVIRHFEIAVGVAELAGADFEEAHQTLLEPWSRGEDGWTGQLASLHTTWLMCHSELLAPVALRTAVVWATQGTPEQRATAAHAFSGILGVLYPEEAATRLWQLIVQAKADDFTASFAMASLFASLVAGAPASAEVVITKLLAEHNRATNHRSRAHAARVLGHLLSVKDHLTGRSAIFTAFPDAPERIAVRAHAWSTALGYAPIRGAVLDALLDGFRDLPILCESPDGSAAAFGTALAAVGTPRDITTLAHDLAHRLKRRQHRARLGHPAGPGHREADLDRLVRIVIDAMSNTCERTQLDRKTPS